MDKKHLAGDDRCAARATGTTTGLWTGDTFGAAGAHDARDPSSGKEVMPKDK